MITLLFGQIIFLMSMAKTHFDAVHSPGHSLSYCSLGDKEPKYLMLKRAQNCIYPNIS